IGDTAMTFTVSVTLASCSAKSTLRISASATWTSDTFASLKLGSVTAIWYVPGSTDGNRYVPVASLTVDRTAPAALRASTVAPGSTAPEVSLTTPSMVPRCSCAADGNEKSKAHSSAFEMRSRISVLLKQLKDKNLQETE